MPKQKEVSLREQFLKSFILNLIQNIPENIITDLPHDFRMDAAPISKIANTESIPYPQGKIGPLGQSKELVIGEPSPKPLDNKKTNEEPIKAKPTIQPPTKTASILGLSRLYPILNDPSVISVECPGPAKHLIVNKSGVLQTASTTLSKEEISHVLKEISEKTNIPIIPGIFKAAFNNMILTAVTSDIAGSRFVIQKRQPIFRRAPPRR
jgi:hypothetical protein